jgi:hypothetical protein
MTSTFIQPNAPPKDRNYNYITVNSLLATNIERKLNKTVRVFNTSDSLQKEIDAANALFLSSDIPQTINLKPGNYNLSSLIVRDGVTLAGIDFDNQSILNVTELQLDGHVQLKNISIECKGTINLSGVTSKVTLKNCNLNCIVRPFTVSETTETLFLTINNNHYLRVD